MRNLPESKLPSSLKWICEKCIAGTGETICGWREIDGELCPKLSKLIYDLGQKRKPWISIKAGLPKTYKNVHIFYAGSLDDIGFYSSYRKQWFLSNGRIAYGVTHWKYLDPPPEVDAQ